MASGATRSRTSATISSVYGLTPHVDHPLVPVHRQAHAEGVRVWVVAGDQRALDRLVRIIDLGLGAARAAQYQPLRHRGQSVHAGDVATSAAGASPQSPMTPDHRAATATATATATLAAGDDPDAANLL